MHVTRRVHVWHMTHACMHNACAIALRIHVWHLMHSSRDVCIHVWHLMHSCVMCGCTIKLHIHVCMYHNIAYSCVALNVCMYVCQHTYSCVARDACMRNTCALSLPIHVPHLTRPGVCGVWHVTHAHVHMRAPHSHDFGLCDKK